MGYRAIVFDLGGVLLDSEDAHESAARRVVARFGLWVPADRWLQIRGAAYESFFDEVLALPQNAGCSVPAVDASSCAYDCYCEEVLNSARLFPESIRLLELCRSSFEFMAVATSSEWRLVHVVLHHFGLGKYFDGVVSGDHVTQKKPAPEAFLVAAWLLGVKPRDMLVVEDSMHGIRAARLARARAIGLATSKDPQTLQYAEAHHVVADHAELSAYIAALARAGSAVRRPA